MSKPFSKHDLARAFHQEMIGLAHKHVELMAAVDQAFADGYDEEDIEKGISPGTRLVFGMRAEYHAQAKDLGRRFDAAKLPGDWNTHFFYCGAKKIIDDDMSRRPG